MNITYKILSGEEFSEFVEQQIGFKKQTIKAMEELYGLKYLTSVYDSLNSIWTKRENPFIAVALSTKHQLLGYAAVSTFKNGPNNRDRDVITAIAVRKTHRGMSISSKLLSKIVEECIMRHELTQVDGPALLSLSTLSCEGKENGITRLVSPIEKLLKEYPELVVSISEMDRDLPVLQNIIETANNRLTASPEMKF